ncbi:hypothetical protein RFI_12154, partial [Reticulomyxa filosa]
MSSGDIQVYFGDKVTLDDGAVGEVRFIGELTSKSEIVYGVDLTTGKGKNNGSLDGVTYFTVKNKAQMSGRFVTRSSIQKASKTSQSSKFTIGESVTVQGAQKGVIRYLGIPAFASSKKVHYGIELSDAKGENDGSKRGQKYFRCEMKHGIFVSNESHLTPSRKAAAAAAADAKDSANANNSNTNGN